MKQRSEESSIAVVETPDVPALPPESVEAIKRYASRARSDNTRRSYEALWKHFVAWCAAKGYAPMPAHPLTIAAYMTARADDGKAAATINSARGAIAEAHRLAGHKAPMRDLRVEETWRGIRNTIGVAPKKQAYPIVSPLLRELVEATPPTLRGLRDRAMILLGFAGAFRRSSLVALNVEDVSSVESGLAVIIRRSKTDQEGRGTTIGIPYGSGDTCPIAALEAWRSAASITSGPIFRGVDRWDNVRGRVTAQIVALIVKKAIDRVGENSENFSGHSLRAGFATSAARAGKSTHAIKRQGVWKSTQTLDRYIREVTLFDQNAAEGLL